MVEIFSVAGIATELFPEAPQRKGCQQVALWKIGRRASEMILGPVRGPPVTYLAVYLFRLIAVKNATGAGKSCLGRQGRPQVQKAIDIPKKGKVESAVTRLGQQVWEVLLGNGVSVAKYARIQEREPKGPLKKRLELPRAPCKRRRHTSRDR